MLEGVFIAILAVALVLQIIAVYEESVIFSMLSIMFWFTLMANALYIEVPYAVGGVNTTGYVNVVAGTHTYCEYGLAVMFMSFVFFDIVWALIQYMKLKKQDGLP